MLHIKFSNRFERLLDALLGEMATPPPSPFVREEIIVPSMAVRRQIELAAADRFGICSNVQFSFLAQWLWRQIGHVVKVSESSPFTTPVLTWRALGLFSEKAFVAEHSPLARYLALADDVSDGSFRAVAPLRLPEHETAFATTVHKAQGSEFDQVLLLPAKPNRVVTRELLYTAVTRRCHDCRWSRGAGEGDCFAYAKIFGVGGAVGGCARLTCLRHQERRRERGERQDS